ncbi:MAG: hypothetical protein ABR577_13090 [Pyrinomonadaceae bacterium]
MSSVSRNQNAQRIFLILLALLFASSHARPVSCQTQAIDTSPINELTAPADTLNEEFRIERLKVANGGELITIFGNLRGLPSAAAQAGAQHDVPLVSVLRDTLGDDDPENDKLRYVWMLTYTKPTVPQKLSAAIPFLYTRLVKEKREGTKTPVSGHVVPPPVIDLAAPDHQVWGNFFWTALENIFIDPVSIPVKASARAYRRNIDDYRKAHITRARAILSLYEATTPKAEQPFSVPESRDIQARLALTEKPFGGIVSDTYLQRVYGKRIAETRDVRGHNWELLRQRAEAESLYFEPLELPDKSATHALLWVSRADLERDQNRLFNKRFLNIASPWQDRRLRSWSGYTKTVYFDAENRRAAKDTPGAHPVDMIPLALYGLDHPKIPILLVDFRDRFNPKKREMSRRAVQDVARDVLSLSRFGDVPYFFGRTIYNFVAARRGMDINQPSRLRAASELKLLLSLDATLDPQLRDEIAHRLESVSLNPIGDDYEAEAQLARLQYAALVAYAKRPDGLPARLDADRRVEAVSLKHGRGAQTLFRVANILSFDVYTHREKPAPTLDAQLALQRSLAYHERFLREVSKNDSQIEVAWNIEDVRRSLRFISDHGAPIGKETAKATARIFTHTEDEETRRLCVDGLYRINNETAKKELLRLYQDQRIQPAWRALTAEYLRKAMQEEQRIAPNDAKTIVSVVGQ